MPADVLRDLERLRYEYLLAQGRARRDAGQMPGAAGYTGPTVPLDLGTLTYAPEAPPADLAGLGPTPSQAGGPGGGDMAALLQAYLLDRGPAGPPRPAQAPTMPPEQPGLPDISREMPDPTTGRATDTLGAALSGGGSLDPLNALARWRLQQFPFYAQPKPEASWAGPTDLGPELRWPTGAEATRTLEEEIASGGGPVGVGSLRGAARIGPVLDRGGRPFEEWVKYEKGGVPFLHREVAGIPERAAERLRETVGGRARLATREIPVDPQALAATAETRVTPGAPDPRETLGAKLYGQLVAAGTELPPLQVTGRRLEQATAARKAQAESLEAKMRGLEEVTDYPLNPDLRTSLGHREEVYERLTDKERELLKLRAPKEPKVKTATQAELRAYERAKAEHDRAVAPLEDKLRSLPESLMGGPLGGQGVLTGSPLMDWLAGKSGANWWLNAYPQYENFVQKLKHYVPEAKVDKGDPRRLALGTAATSPQTEPIKNLADMYEGYGKLLTSGRKIVTYKPDTPYAELPEELIRQIGVHAMVGGKPAGGHLMLGNAQNLLKAFRGEPFTSPKVSNMALDLSAAEWAAVMDRWATNTTLRSHSTLATLADPEYFASAKQMTRYGQELNQPASRVQAGMWTGGKALRDSDMRQFLDSDITLEQAIPAIRGIIEMQGSRFVAEVLAGMRRVTPAVAAAVLVLQQTQGGGAPPEQ